MSVRARFYALDEPEALALALRALGFPAGAESLLGSSLARGHILVSGVPPALAELVRELCGRPGMPRLLEGRRPGTLLLSGRLGAIKHLGNKLQDRPDVELAVEGGGQILRACFHAGERPVVRIGRLEAGSGRTLIMGILNVTPDSFSDGGRHAEPTAALRHAEALVEAGADLIDVGGESTRPKGLYGEGARPVSAEEERRRVEPVVRALHKAFPELAISVDTSKAEVARAAIDAGAVLINDVRGLASDELADLIRRNEHVAGALMHMPAEPDRMAALSQYEDVVAEVADALCALVDRAVERGVPRERLLVDPGLGFGKNYGQNLFLLRELGRLRAAVGRPVLIGPSRKGFLGYVTGRPVEEREAATAASVVAAILGGASVVRVHDVAACRDAFLVADAIRQGEAGGSFYEDPAEP